MAVVARRVRNIAVSHLRVGREQGSRRLVAANDGIHFLDVSGDATISNCSLSELADDGLNVHTFYFRIIAVIDKRTVLVDRRSAYFRTSIASSELAVGQGDKVQMARSDTLEVFFASVVESVRETDAGIEVELRGIIPGGATSALLCAVSRLPSLTVANCAFSNSRARGVLVHSSASIVDCTFRNISMSAVLLEADAAAWGEGCNVSGVKIARNNIDLCGTRSGSSIAIRSLVGSKGLLLQSRMPNVSNVDIVENIIVQQHGAMIDLVGGVGVRIEGNQFARGGGPGKHAVVRLNSSENVTVSGNSCDVSGAIQYSRDSREVEINNNVNCFSLSVDH